MSVRGLCFAHVSGCESGVCFGECWQDCVKSYQLYGISTTPPICRGDENASGCVAGLPLLDEHEGPAKVRAPEIYI